MGGIFFLCGCGSRSESISDLFNAIFESNLTIGCIVTSENLPEIIDAVESFHGNGAEIATVYRFLAEKEQTFNGKVAVEFMDHRGGAVVVLETRNVSKHRCDFLFVIYIANEEGVVKSIKVVSGFNAIDK